MSISNFNNFNSNASNNNYIGNTDNNNNDKNLQSQKSYSLEGFIEALDDLTTMKYRPEFKKKLTDSEYQQKLQEREDKLKFYKNIANTSKEAVKKQQDVAQEYYKKHPEKLKAYYDNNEQQNKDLKQVEGNNKNKIEKNKNLSEKASGKKRKLQIDEKTRKQSAKTNFEQYVNDKKLQEQINYILTSCNGYSIGYAKIGYVKDAETIYYGMIKNGQPHGIGVMIAEDGNIYDDQLLKFYHGSILDEDELQAYNLGGIFAMGEDTLKCDETEMKKYNNFMCFDTLDDDLYSNFENYLSNVEKNPDLYAFVINFTMHGGNNGEIYDPEGLMCGLNTITEQIKQKGVTITKPILIIKSSCHDARSVGERMPESSDDYDTFCKNISTITSNNVICAYHQSKDTLHITKHIAPLGMAFDLSFDYYSNGILQKANISAKEMNKLMGNVLNGGTWDIPDNNNDLSYFLSALYSNEKIPEPFKHIIPFLYSIPQYGKQANNTVNEIHTGKDKEIMKDIKGKCKVKDKNIVPIIIGVSSAIFATIVCSTILSWCAIKKCKKNKRNMNNLDNCEINIHNNQNSINIHANQVRINDDILFNSPNTENRLILKKNKKNEIDATTIYNKNTQINTNSNNTKKNYINLMPNILQNDNDIAKNKTKIIKNRKRKSSFEKKSSKKTIKNYNDHLSKSFDGFQSDINIKK